MDPSEYSDAKEQLTDFHWMIERVLEDLIQSPLQDLLAKEQLTDLDWVVEYVLEDLIQSPFWKDCQAGHIWDNSVEPREPLPCQDQQQLLFELLRVLGEYTAAGYVTRGALHAMDTRARVARMHLADMCNIFLAQRKKRALSESARSKTKGVSTKSVVNAMKVMTRIATSLTPDDYVPYTHDIGKSFALQSLVDNMSKAFTAYGPASFSQRATFYAIADILSYCKIEPGTTQKIAQRLLKMNARAQKPKRNARAQKPA